MRGVGVVHWWSAVSESRFEQYGRGDTLKNRECNYALLGASQCPDTHDL